MKRTLSALFAELFAPAPMAVQAQDNIADLKARAEAGEAEAQNGLGELYYWGQGVAQDYAEAARWYRKAAEQGYAGAQYNMGWLYSAGQGVAQDAAEASRWYRKAAEQGVADAQSSLGFLYLKGRGVIQDDREAYIWFSLATASGLASAEKARDVIGPLLLPTDRNAAREEARKRFEKIRARRRASQDRALQK